MSRALDGNPYADEADTGNCVPDAYVQAQASLALAHEVRTLTLVLVQAHGAAHGVVATPEIAARLGI
ncbi:hypothetical protein [Arthrobacter sp. efr-133-TYG-118]|uniref:hypothetical protein n=1 Tax=Arthrobacter sp. efr-133-TYG-118 TaxID=3040279 RepID=UPI00255051CB|nr:hypothetical protein [Arthrobacter sp. efr-133-TYG-118]